MKKNILGLDLGTTSIGWAHVIEDENPQEQSSIVQIGVRVNPLTVDEISNFEKGKAITTNAERTLKRSIRRSLKRYQLRREQLREVLIKAGIINSNTILAEDGKGTTYETWRLRSDAVTRKIEKDEFARVLFAINKKRGYKSSRKVQNNDEGKRIDGMDIAKKLYDEHITPGQLAYDILKSGHRKLPDFYRSDLKSEFDKIWNCQNVYYPDIFTHELYQELQGKGQKATSAIFWNKCQLSTAEIKEIDNDLKSEKTISFPSRLQKKLQLYKWRTLAINEKLEPNQTALVLTEINNEINQSSGYLGAISDRSKELYFNKMTVGQYLYQQIKSNPHQRLKNQVFYRQDYLDEFEAIWEAQKKYHSEMTDTLKEEIRDIIIFYQRKLKSQKGLISLCAFESKEIEVNGKKKTVGPRVAPRSSPLFQEFKIWQMLHNIKIEYKGNKGGVDQSLTQQDKGEYELNEDQKSLLFEELNIKGNLTSNQILEVLKLKPTSYKLNYDVIEGNKTNRALYNIYLKILDLEGYDEELLKLSDKDDIDVGLLKQPACEIKEMISSIFSVLGINKEILDFNAELDGDTFEQQLSYQLWHLLYSVEDDNLKYSEEEKAIYGNDQIGLKKKLCSKFGFKPEHARILAGVVFEKDYGNLSTKAMRKIYPFIKESKYSDACKHAGYNHSPSSLTEEENRNRPLRDKLELIKKNSLRNPVVEKILNQMVNLVNALIEKNKKTNSDFRFDEIHIELARELKKNAKERALMTQWSSKGKAKHDKIAHILKSEFGITHPTRNDIIRYKLYEELKNNGYKDLYTDTYIPREMVFSKSIDVDHIIPQSRLFDDSFSNKTLTFRNVNIDKGQRTASDYIMEKYGVDGWDRFVNSVNNLFALGEKNEEEGISKAKKLKLLKKGAEIGDGFIERDLRDSQYIAVKAKAILSEICRNIISTSGSITDKLREDWGLINVMKELNLPKYRVLGMTEFEERRSGNKIEVIKEWTKRNDHRHHALDALTVAFTKRQHIQYLNHLNARFNVNSKDHPVIMGIESKFTHFIYDEDGNKKRVFIPPMEEFREQVKLHLEHVLVSHKAKNKVVTRNINKIKLKKGIHKQQCLTPRGQLHKETIYGKYHYIEVKEEKVGAKFNKEIIDMVANPLYRHLLMKRLEENGFDSKKAFTGKNALNKSPIYIDDTKQDVVPEKVKVTYHIPDFSIKKDVTPENFKDEKTIEKILDERVKTIMLNRLRENGNNPKIAFSNLEKNPIWLNREKGITIKRVKISGVNNAIPLHVKKDHLGQIILNDENKPIPVDYVSTGNNHHVAIYMDAEGNLQERVVSLFEAVQCVQLGLPVIDKSYNADLGWKFLFSMKQNEMFVFPNEKAGFDPKQLDLLDSENRKIISPHLFRVQKLSNGDYWFRHHLETTVDVQTHLKDVTYKRCSLNSIRNIIKVQINHIGEIIRVGE